MTWRCEHGRREARRRDGEGGVTNEQRIKVVDVLSSLLGFAEGQWALIPLVLKVPPPEGIPIEFQRARELLRALTAGKAEG